jgi:hypothetical protein
LVEDYSSPQIGGLLGLHGEIMVLEGFSRFQFVSLGRNVVVRMIPKSWIKELNDAGGFALILKYQLYLWTHKELAKDVASKLNLPVDAPRELQDGTMLRFIKWHERNL